MELDDLDVKILAQLEEDSRVKLKKLARNLKTSITTVNNRIRKLRKEGVIKKFSAEVNYEKLGYEVKAIIGIAINKQDIIKLEKELSRHPSVLCVYDVTGIFDSFIVTRFKSVRDLDNFLKNDLVKESVKQTQTFIVLNTHKEDFKVF
jgi:DNA-binding Lrp family transcriptional regulator